MSDKEYRFLWSHHQNRIYIHPMSSKTYNPIKFRHKRLCPDSLSVQILHLLTHNRYKFLQPCNHRRLLWLQPDRQVQYCLYTSADCMFLNHCRQLYLWICIILDTFKINYIHILFFYAVCRN